MQNKKSSIGPVALTGTYTTNIFNPGTTTGGVGMRTQDGNLYFLIYQIQLIDKGGSGGTVNLFKGATGANSAGTELAKTLTVPANGITTLSYPSGLRFDVGDFLVGGASAGTEITFLAIGEIGVA